MDDTKEDLTVKTFLLIGAALMVATPAVAQERWGSGFGQGIFESDIRNAEGGQFSISCPGGAEEAKPGLLLVIDGMRGGETFSAVPFGIAIDGRTQDWRVERRVLDQNQVIYSWKAEDAAAERRLQGLVRSLRAGRSLTITTPDDQVSQTFTLAGSGAALADCAGPY